MWSLLWAAVFAVWSTELSWNKQACSKREASPALILLSQIGNVTCSSCWASEHVLCYLPWMFLFWWLTKCFSPPPVAWEEKISSWWLRRSDQRPCLGRPTAGSARIWSTLALKLWVGISLSAPRELPGTCPTRALRKTAELCLLWRNWWEK